jgi:hypothetical protein
MGIDQKRDTGIDANQLMRHPSIVLRDAKG